MNLRKKKVGVEFGRTKYADGILPIDTYKKDVDELVDSEYNYDWESLRASISEYGLRHSTLSVKCCRAVPLCQTQQMESRLPRDYLSIKEQEEVPLKQIVPQYGVSE